MKKPPKPPAVSFFLAGDNPVVTSGYLAGKNKKEVFEALTSAFSDAVKESTTPCRYVALVSKTPNTQGSYSWKLYLLRDAEGISETDPGEAGTIFDIYLCRKREGVAEIVQDSPGLLREIRTSMERVRLTPFQIFQFRFLSKLLDALPTWIEYLATLPCGYGNLR